MSTTSMPRADHGRNVSFAAGLEKYANNWLPERDDLSYHVPARVGSSDQLDPGDRRITRDDLVAVLTVQLGGGLSAENSAWEAVRVLMYIASRARGCDPHSASKATIARWVAEGELLRAEHSDTTLAEKRWGHSAEARRSLQVRSERRIRQLQNGGMKRHRALKRWAEGLLARAVTLGLTEGLWHLGRYAKPVVRAAVGQLHRDGVWRPNGFVFDASWAEEHLNEEARSLFNSRCGRPEKRTVKTPPLPRRTAKTTPPRGPQTVKTTPKIVPSTSMVTEDLRSSNPPAAATARYARGLAHSPAVDSPSPSPAKVRLGVHVPKQVFDLLRDDGYDVEWDDGRVLVSPTDEARVRGELKDERVPIKFTEEHLAAEFGCGRPHRVDGLPVFIAHRLRVSNGSAVVPRIVTEHLKMRIDIARGMKSL